MGRAASILTSVLELQDEIVVETVYEIKFSNVPYISDHFDRARVNEDVKAVQLFDGTLMVFDVDEDSITVNKYRSQGTIKGNLKRFMYTNEFFLDYGDVFFVYCMILPTNYYPKQFITSNPHFAAKISDRIRMTWWSKEKIKVTLNIEMNEKKFNKFNYIDTPKFREKHPMLLAAHKNSEDLLAKVISNYISSG